MMTAIRPTTTQRVRAFLAEQGMAPRPWATLDETYAALYRLLRRRCDDNAFWRPLAGLMRDLVTDAADGPRHLPAPQAELLKSWDVEDLVRDLRRALPGRCAPTGDHRRFARSLAAPALGGFLVLGLAAAGCDQVDEVNGEEPPAWAEGCTLDDSSELYAAIDENDTLSQSDKSDLCFCMATLATDSQDSLSALFEQCSTETVAMALEIFVSSCEGDGGTIQGDPSSWWSECWEIGAAYKGVAFPS
jgi:hypothetical protein